MFSYRTHSKRLRGAGLLVPLMVIALVLAACGGGTTNQQQVEPTEVPVNGFGVASNHVHSLLAFPPHVLVMATHYGFFRSEDDGATWKETAAGPGQPMDGLMTYSLTASPLDPQRLYVLTQLALGHAKGILGLYTSGDQGRTWKMSIATASITSGSIYTVAAGNDTPNEVYIYIPALGALGLRISLDDGQHFSTTGTLPFSSIFGVRPIPGAPGHLLVYGSDGMAYSTNGGNSWQVLNNITGAVTEVTTPGPNRPIYASGDAGIYVSQDGGASFKLVYSQASFFSLSVSPQSPQIVYGETAVAVYRSEDGGHTWSALPRINGHLTNLAVDPMDASRVYLSLSYPTELYDFGPDGNVWTSLTPKA
jgi:photosystem II stability/assembly factor-like uncharacterized protein